MAATLFFSKSFQNRLANSNTGIKGFYVSFTGRNYSEFLEKNDKGYYKSIYTGESNQTSAPWRENFRTLVDETNESMGRANTDAPVLQPTEYINDDVLAIDLSNNLTRSDYSGVNGFFLFYAYDSSVDSNNELCSETVNGQTLVYAVYCDFKNSITLSHFVKHVVYIDLSKVANNNYFDLSTNCNYPFIQHYHLYAESGNENNLASSPFNTKTVVSKLKERSVLNSSNRTPGNKFTEGTTYVSETAFGKILKQPSTVRVYPGYTSTTNQQYLTLYGKRGQTTSNATYDYGVKMDDQENVENSINSMSLESYYPLNTVPEGYVDISESALDSSGKVIEKVVLLIYTDSVKTIKLTGLASTSDSVSISWGDGTVDTVKGISKNHTYSHSKYYSVTLTNVSTITFNPSSNVDLYAVMISEPKITNFVFRNCTELTDIYLYSELAYFKGTQTSESKSPFYGSTNVINISTQLTLGDGTVLYGGSKCANLSWFFKGMNVVNTFPSIYSVSAADVVGLYQESSYGSKGSGETLYLQSSSTTSKIYLSYPIQAGKACYGCKKLKSVTINIDPNSVNHLWMNEMLADCTNLKTITFMSNINGLLIPTIDSNLIQFAQGDTTLNGVSGMVWLNPSQMDYAFDGCSNLDPNQLDLTFSSSHCTCQYASYAFRGTKVSSYSITTDNSLEDVSFMFANCSNVSSIDLNLNNVVNFQGIFHGVSLLSEDSSLILRGLSYRVSNGEDNGNAEWGFKNRYIEVGFIPNNNHTMIFQGDFKGEVPQIDLSGNYYLDASTLMSNLSEVSSDEPTKLIRHNLSMPSNMKGWESCTSLVNEILLDCAEEPEDSEKSLMEYTENYVPSSGETTMGLYSTSGNLTELAFYCPSHTYTRTVGLSEDDIKLICNSDTLEGYYGLTTSKYANPTGWKFSGFIKTYKYILRVFIPIPSGTASNYLFKATVTKSGFTYSPKISWYFSCGNNYTARKNLNYRNITSLVNMQSGVLGDDGVVTITSARMFNSGSRNHFGVLTLYISNENLMGTDQNNSSISIDFTNSYVSGVLIQKFI